MLPRVWICTLVILCCAVSAWANSLSVSEIQATGKVLFRALRDSECKVKCKSRKPRIMCGSDGVSYNSKCELKRARRCEGKKVSIVRKGKCSDADVPMTKCFQERDEAETTVSKTGATDVFVPECNSDGTFSEVQCHGASGYCWCVSDEGKPFPRTSTKNGRPNCKLKDAKKENQDKINSRTKRKKEKRKRKPNKSDTRCSSLERTRFNVNLVRVFTEEFNRSMKALPNNKPNKIDPFMDTLEKQVVEWKFSQYDDNNDNLLQRKEVNSLRRLVKKFIKPRSCAKRFLKFCDPDKNKVIERREWSLCLGVDINNDQHETTTHVPEVKTTGESLDLNKLLNKKSSPSSLSNKAPSTGQIERPAFPSLPINIDDTWTDFSRPRPDDRQSKEKQESDCETDRLSALEQERDNPDAGIFIPNCTREGKWTSAQCHKSTGYCWCVEENSGRPISGTSTHGVSPQCDFEGDRDIPESVPVGCTYAEKQSFLSDLLNTLVAEMADYALSNKTDHSILVTDPEQSIHERTVRWKFSFLDLNRNQNLESSEMEKFKDTLKEAQKKATRKCARKFVDYCDADDNKTVSLQEWVDCMGVTRNINFNLPSNPKRIGKNPFDQYLRDS